MTDSTMKDPGSQSIETQTAKAVWETLEDETQRQDHSHWRGVGRWADDLRWQEIGRRTRSNLDEMLRLYGRLGNYWNEPKVMLEWGQGGGANAFAFQDRASSYYGVDISSKNLDECGRMLRAENYQNFKPVLVEKDPREAAIGLDDDVDVFISTAVFQHFPSKEYGVKVLRTVRGLMSRGGIGLVQIRFDNGNDKYRPIQTLEEYREKHLTATSYRIDEFFDILKDCGFNGIFVRDVATANNYATFCFKVAD